MTLRRCDACGSTAVWEYAPNGKYAFCDAHVPRGCSCQLDEKGFAYTDGSGRDLPCVEYDFDDEGFESANDQNLEKEHELPR